MSSDHSSSAQCAQNPEWKQILQPHITKSEPFNTTLTVSKTLGQLAGRELQTEHSVNLQTNETVLPLGNTLHASESTANITALTQFHKGINQSIDTHHDSILPTNQSSAAIGQTPQSDQCVMLKVGSLNVLLSQHKSLTTITQSSDSIAQAPQSDQQLMVGSKQSSKASGHTNQSH